MRRRFRRRSSTHVMDVKGLFVLDKMNGKPHEEISEDARKQLV